MALYIPAGRRRRRALGLAGATLVLGLVIGVMAGRLTAPSVDDRVRSVSLQARQTAAGLRVLALHDQAGALSNQNGGTGGADLVLQRTRTQLEQLFSRAPWVARTKRDELLHALDALQSLPDRSGTAFATAADALAGDIEVTFGAARQGGG